MISSSSDLVICDFSDLDLVICDLVIRSFMWAGNKGIVVYAWRLVITHSSFVPTARDMFFRISDATNLIPLWGKKSFASHNESLAQ